MDKKKPVKNDDTTINFRIPKVLKAKIEEKAEEKNVTTSAYVRDLLESVHNGDYCHHEVVKSRINEFLFSKEFMQLMIWIYTKKTDNSKTEHNDELERYIKTLKQVEGHMPNDLVKEFDKVLIDIIKMQDEKNPFVKYSFHSSSTDGRKTFNKDKVEKFLLNNLRLKMFILTMHQKTKNPTN
jgi:hypothetical protein